MIVDQQPIQLWCLDCSIWWNHAADAAGMLSLAGMQEKPAYFPDEGSVPRSLWVLIRIGSN